MLDKRLAPDVTVDAALGGRLSLAQPRRGHRFGHDAILLAAATPARDDEHAVELGAGVGAAGLALAARVAGVNLTLVEIDPDLARLAGENAARNGMATRVRAVALDVAAPARAFAAAGLPLECAMRVLMNPPFNDPARQQASPEQGRRLAHLSPSRLLEVWTRTAARLLRPRGTLTLIWRADGLAGVLDALARGFGAAVVLPVHPRPGEPAIRVLVRATKGGRAPLALFPGLVLNDARGKPTAEAEAVLRGGAPLPLGLP
jgi:tRNA1(Val) A37 N6-methylase TrmN6